MTSGQAELKDVATRAANLRDQIDGRLSSSSPPTASHAITVIVPSERPPAVRYAVAVGATLIALALTIPAASFLQRVIFVLFWPAVIGAAWFGGLGPAIVSSALSVFLVDYYIVSPSSIDPTSPDDLIPLAVFLLASVAVATMTSAARAARKAASQAAIQNAELAHELELQAMELEQQLEESQSLAEELEQSTEELGERTAAAESAELYTKGILESIAHPFVVHDADWRFRYINDAATMVFRGSSRASHDSPIGRVLWEVYPDIVGTVFEREMRRAAMERKPVSFEAFYPARGEWSMLSCFPLVDGGLATQWTDITERKRAEDTEHYLSKASNVLSSSLEYETTLDQLARIVVPQLADWCVVHVVENGGPPRQVAVAHVDEKKIGWARELNARYPTAPSARTGVPNVLRTGQPELYPDIGDDMLVAGAIDDEHLRITRALGLKSALLVPLLVGTKPIGVLTLVGAESGRRFSERDLPLASELARRAAVAVQHARLHREAVVARGRAEQLQRITSALAAATTEQEIAQIVVSHMREAARPNRIAIFRVVSPNDVAELELMDQVGVDAERRQRFTRVPLSAEMPVTNVIRRGEPLFLSDRESFFAAFPTWPRHDRAPEDQAWVALPLKASTGSPLAAIALAFDEVKQFSGEERGFIVAIGDQATQAFERVGLLQTEHIARESAEEANRAKTQFLATMSHELRTPLNAISGYAELLSLGLRGPTTPEQQEDLGRIMRSQRHLLSVINDILNFARLEAGHVEYHVADVPVADLLNDLESLIRPQLAAKDLAFSCDPITSNMVARADSEKVRQVLLNLLANAVKFTTAGGRVRVTCDFDDAHVFIRVLDTGIGIPTDRRGAIFEPFVQLHRTLAQPAEGTGLGLAISRDLARGMGGELSVESEQGRGSTFTLALQRVSPRA